jgi:mitochondrial pyruvate carrier 2
MKWGVVLAGASDFVRPAEKLSITQNLALMATGSIWTRWCFVIRPKNMLWVLTLKFLKLPAPKYPSSQSRHKLIRIILSRLAAVNCCLFIVGTVQVSRILIWQSKQKGSLKGAVKELGDDLKSTAKSAESEVVEDAKKAKAEL